MISYLNAISEYEAARLASQDDQWNENERAALALIAEYEEWKYAINDIFNSDATGKEVDEMILQHEAKCPDVSTGDSPFGQRYTVHPRKPNHLTFYFHKATSGYNIGIKNSDLGE